MIAHRTARSAKPPVQAGWLLFLAAFAHLILTIDFTIVYVALPGIGRELNFSEQTLQWVVHGYTVAFGGFLLLGGRTSDLLGRRRVFVVALLLFAAASLLGGLANEAWTMVTARALQGLAAAFIFPSTLALINSSFEGGNPRNRALAVWSLAGPTGLALGSLLGGVLVSAFGWEAVFLVNVPLGVLLAFGALLMLSRDKARTEPRRFDLAGACTATFGVTLLVAVLVKGPDAGWTAQPILLGALLSAALLIGFVAIERRGAAPLMPLRLLSNRNLTTGMMLTAVLMSTFMALSYFQTMLFQEVLGLDPFWTGLAFLVPCLAQAVGTRISTSAVAKVGLRATIMTGFVIGACGTVLMALEIAPGSTYAALVPGLIIGYIGHGMAFGPTWTAVSQDVEPSEHGIASALASTTFQVGGAVGMAILVAAANSSTQMLMGIADGLGTTDGMRVSFLIVAAGIALGCLIASRLRTSSRRATVPAE